MKKIILFFVGILFFSGYHLAYANLIINEIMYAPAAGSDYEWIEIFNSGGNAIDLNNYRFFHGETNSGPLTLRNGNTTVLQPSEYAIVAKSQTNYAWLNFSGMILSASTVSLPDSGDNTYIAISDSNKVIFDSIKYDPSLGGSKESGNSLQKISGAWRGRIPTPGTANEVNSLNSFGNENSTNDNSSSQNTFTLETKNKTTEEPKIKTKITAQALAFSGIPVSFQANAFGYNKEPLYYGKYFWNFGDGDSKEIKANGLSDVEKLAHAYFYPGEYNVTLEYYVNYYGNVPDASDKMIIKVVPADFLISRIGEEKDFFVELSNNTNYDADISKWILSSSAKSFTMPRNTIIGSKKKIIFSQKITNFSISDKNNLKLLNPQGELIFDYSASILAPVAAIPTKTIIQPKPKISVSQDKIDFTAVEPLGEYLKNENKTNPLADLQIPVENLEAPPENNLGGQASVVGSDVATGNSWRTYILTTILTILIGASAGAVYFIRQKRIIPNAPGDDFKILDE